MSDPFAPPSAAGATRTNRSWVPFLVRRAVIHVVVPGLAATAALVRDVQPRWDLALAVFAAGTVIWLPTSAGLAWTRFLAPKADPHPVVLTDAEVLSRASYVRYQALSLVELALMLVGLLLVAGQLVAYARWTWPLGLGALGIAGWSIWRARDVFAISAAVVGHAAHDADVVIARAGPLMGRRNAIGDNARVLVAHARLRQGDADAALDALAGAHDPVGSSADLVAAQIRLARGDTGPARRALAAPRRQTAGVTWAREVLRAHLDLTEGRADVVLQRAESAWPALRRAWPAPWGASLDLMAAAAHRRAGDAAAGERLVRQIPDLEARRWMARIWPDTFGWLG